MYQAELKGKLSTILERREDILTSNIFSFLKYSNRKKYLKSIINELGLEVSESDLLSAEFNFWPKYDDKTEPDVVIIVGKFYLLFEAKYFSDFSIDQIKREINGGIIESKNMNKQFYYIAITKDYNYKPEKFRNLNQHLSTKFFRWINWQKFCFIIEQNIKENDSDYNMAQDLYELLLKKNLRQFIGYNRISTDINIKKYEKIFFNYLESKFRGKFIGFKKSLSVLNYAFYNSKKNIFYNHNYFNNILKIKKIEPINNIFWKGEKKYG